jgi:hypothetical protein
MPKVELYINLQLCDLTGSEQIEVDYTSFDISKIGSRGGARSYSFNLPKTNRNKAVLENPEIVNNLSTLPYTRLPCRILVDGIDVQIRFAEIQSAKDVYAVRVYGANSDLFAKLKDKKLWDLDLSEYDHRWNLTNVLDSRLNREGYIYAVIDYHEDSPNFAINNDNRVVRIDYMPPSFYVNTLLEKIFSEAGYEFVNEIEDDTALLIMPLHFKEFELAPFVSEKYAGEIYITSRMEIPADNGVERFFAFDGINNYSGSYYNFPYYVPANFWSSIPARAILFQDRILLFMSCSFQVTFTNAFNWLGVTFTLHDFNGVVLKNDSFDYQNNPVGTSTITIDFPCINPFFVPGNNYYSREFYYTVHFFNKGVFLGYSGSIYLEDTSTITIEEVRHFGELLAFNNYLQLNTIMPDMTQGDFLKNYILLFGLSPIINEQTNTVTLRKFDSIINKLGNGYDWSNKVDNTEIEEITYMMDNYAQNNNFLWMKDGDEPKPVDADSIIIINNKNLELEKDIFELDFSATNANYRLNTLGVGDNIVPQIGIYNQGEWSNEKNMRFLNLVFKTSSDIGGSMTYDDGVGTQLDFNDNIPFTYFISLTESWNLGFGNNILSNYYQAIINVISRLKILKVYVRLSAADISQLDFSRPVWIAKHESYFYISSIKGFSYTENKSTIVELVKLNING